MSTVWHLDGYIDINWENSNMYKGLNGSCFLNNTTYEYMQNSTWLNKIENCQWTAVNTKTWESGPDYASVTTEQMYLHEMNRSNNLSSVGVWTNKCKDSLM